MPHPARSFWSMSLSVSLSALALGLCVPSIVIADEPAVAEVPVVRHDENLHDEIDRLIVAGLPDYERLAAPLASDAEFLRRITLDLIGQLPTTAQTRAFLADADPLKRETLIERLLADPASARQLQRMFDLALMRRLPVKHVPVAEWEAFLRKSFAANKGYDAIVREILSADGTDPKNRGPARFVLDREGDSHEITRDIGRVFLGANIECAQCHDHPLVDDFKQAHYYGIQAFLVRSFLHTDEKKLATLAEKAEGEVTFESVFDIRDKKSSGPKSLPPQVFERVAFTEPKFEKGQEYVVAPDDKKKTVRPVPKFSRREHLAQAIAGRENRRFARTAVNRVWCEMFGRGLVHPLDADHAANPPSHPELLDFLTDAFVRNDFDVKHLMREIALSRTYQRSSRSTPSSDPAAEPVKEDRFARAILKPLSPSQFAWSILQATGEADVHRATFGDKLTEEALHQRLAGHEGAFVNLFGGLPGEPPQSFDSTVDQVLYLSNHSTVASFLVPKPGNLADRLLKLPTDRPTAIAEELYLSILVRAPTAEESDEVAEYLKEIVGEARTAAVRDLIWAVVMSSEFRFVH